MSRNSLILGIDIGGTKTKIGYVEENKLNIISNFSTPRDPDIALDKIETELRSFHRIEELRGIGIGCPGPLSQEQGTVLAPPNLRQWDDFPLVSLLEERFKVTVLLENDGNAGALGEAFYGTGKGYATVLYCTISTGIGIGIVIDGKAHQGYRGLAGETWAFEPENYFGKNNGINILDRSAGAGIVRIAKEKLEEKRDSLIPRDEVTTKTIVAAYEQKDELAREVMQQGQDILAGMLVNAATLLAPDIIVLAGGLCTKPEWYVEPIIERVRAWMPIEGLRDIPIRRAHLWDSAVLYGAIKMVEQEVEE